MNKPIVMSFSSGKDSFLMLEALQQQGWQVAEAFTTLTKEDKRVTMHGVPHELFQRQVEELGIPVREVLLPRWPSNELYEQTLGELFKDYLRQGYDHVAFGDIYLEDIKAYREKFLEKIGMKGVFPIWKQDTQQLAERFIELGFQAIVVCIDLKALDFSYLGRTFDRDFLRELPQGVDPCGEKGEFHTFVFAGPVFHNAIPVQIGEKSQSEGFGYCELFL